MMGKEISKRSPRALNQHLTSTEEYSHWPPTAGNRVSRKSNFIVLCK